MSAVSAEERKIYELKRSSGGDGKDGTLSEFVYSFVVSDGSKRLLGEAREAWVAQCGPRSPLRADNGQGRVCMECAEMLV